MTREEAIKLIDTHTVCFYNEIDSPTLQALHMAIEALKEQTTIPMFKESTEAYKAWTGEEMDELIKRNGVYVNGLELPSDCYECVLNNDVMCCRGHETLQHDLIFHDMTTRPNWCPLREIHDADRPKGEWIKAYNGNGWNDLWDYRCSNCGKKYERADAVLYHANYCPNCGADMRGEEE